MALVSVRVQIDGTWHELTYNEESGAYEAEFTAPEASNGLPGGYYNITAEAENDAGELASADAASVPGLKLFVNEAAPPTLEIYRVGYVVDSENIKISGTAKDELQGVVISAMVNGAEAATAHAGADGGFLVAVPLEVGENAVVITATNESGKTASASARVIRLITDRTAVDVMNRNALVAAVRNGTATAEQTALFIEAALRGAYNHTDTNRVSAAMAYLAEILKGCGITVNYTPLSSQSVETAMRPPQMTEYINAVKAFRSALTAFPDTPQAPNTAAAISGLDFSAANDIEKILSHLSALIINMQSTVDFSWTLSEAFTGLFAAGG